MATPPAQSDPPSGSPAPLPPQPSSPPTPTPPKPSPRRSRHRRPPNPQKPTPPPPTYSHYPPKHHHHHPIYPYHHHHPYPVMNHPYGSPYPPPQHYHQPPPNSASQHQYYPVQYPPHTTHSYPPYQYPPMLMYSSHRPSVPPEPQQPVSPQLPPATSGKRKRASSGPGDRSDEETLASGSDVPRTPVPSAAQQSTDPKKRTKTQRACDSCRSRKIRCDILPDSEPPTCQHCKQYGFDCTFHLPITETRFKKKKLDEDAGDKEVAFATTSSPQTDSQPSVFGPTSAAHLLHSHATITSRIYENYDLRYQHTFEVTKSGDGLISVQKPTVQEQQQAHAKPIDFRIERDVIEQLVNSYFQHIAPILPVITQAEFLANPNPPPMLLYSICLVAASRREVPQTIFDSIRFAVSNAIKAEDVLSTASIANVQSLLILSMTGDCHSQFVPNAMSALWTRLGTAIRMAQDLGLHRAETFKQNVELRRRLWAICLICDRWTSLAYGQPYMIDVRDCDARLPSSGDPTDLYLDELVRLSVIVGKVLKAIYSPSGLTFTTDEMLHTLLSDMDNWKAHLPDQLKFCGAETPLSPGLLHLLYTCVCMMFWRVFMRISYSCPAHLKFGLTVERWSELVNMTGEAIDWLDVHENLYDSWLLVAYTAVSCALVQYHTWARRQDDEAAAKLRKLRDTVRRWEASIHPDHMSVRRKTAEIIVLLYEATQGPQHPLEAPEAPALNPTGGVTAKPFIDLDYKKDPSRPGGGVFIARGKVAHSEVLKDIPAGVVETIETEGESSRDAPASFPLPASERTVRFSPSPFVTTLASDGTIAGSASSATQIYNGSGSMLRSTVHQPQQPGQGSPPTSPLVNFTPLNRLPRNSNVNPALNRQGQQSGTTVQVMNLLDSTNTLQNFALADNGFLEGIPGGMFDWGQWETFFSRFTTSQGTGTQDFMFQPPQSNQPSL